MKHFYRTLAIIGSCVFCYVMTLFIDAMVTHPR